MKVTVCFGNVRVVVPCGSGEILVQNLIEKAIHRYKKATGRPAGSWVTVHNLQSLSDGGILDPDDKLNDVADDREQIIAIYEENGPPPHLSDNGGGGTSASSVGTESPDMFRSEDCTSDASTGQPECHTDVEITGDCVPLGISTLQVRRGSEPALNRLSPAPNGVYVDPMKRWSTAVALGDKNQRCSELDHEKLEERSDAEVHSDREDGSEEKSAFIPFSREAGRISILGNNLEMNRWADAADRQVYKLLDSRREPIGAPNLIHPSKNHDRNQLVVLKNDGRPLGIHVVPECEENGRAQDIFKEAMLEREISLRLSKINGCYRPPAPVYPHRPLESSKSDADFDHERMDGHDKGTINTQTYPPAGQRSAIAVMNSNTRRIGKKYHIKLTKGPNGLGFSITTRDNVAGGNCPFYIKKIMPVGAAIDDGRLQPGDRLLEVNGVEMTGKSQDEAVALLRNASPGSEVHLTVSRQEQVESSPKLPRAIPPEKICDDNAIFPWKQRESFTFDIPLNDTGSAGLGVSVKGKTSTGPNGTSDLGIFVKSVIRGGAAYKDGRLRENDQLTNINGVTLLKMPNSQAMETLRRVMHQEGPQPGAITLTVARRIQLGSSNSASFSLAQNTSTDFSSSDKSQTPTSDTSTTDSDRTAVYCPYRSKTNGEEDHNLNQGNVTKIEDKDLGLDYLPITRNPVVERITGQKMPRNDSFYQACHDSWNNTPVKKYVNGNHPHPLTSRTTHYGMMSPTIIARQDESVIIENEYVSSSQQSSQKAKSSRSATPENLLSESKQSMESDNCRNVGDTSAPYVSQISLDEGEGPNFERAGFGRQSMSEKRNAQLDAKNTDTWQRNKRAREARDRDKTDEPSPLTKRNVGSDPSQSNLVRCNSADSVISAVRAVNISSGHLRERMMKRSSSLESLPKEEEIYGRGNGAGSRSRVCNESFRAAVDRSYDAPGAADDNMETLEEESESGSSNQVGRGIFLPGIELVGEESNLNTKESGNAINKAKKKGLLKNLGSVFKFGKNKKDPPVTHSKTNVEIEPHYTKVDPEMNYIRKLPEDENKETLHCEKKQGPRREEEKCNQHHTLVNANNNIPNSHLYNNTVPGWPPREDISAGYGTQAVPGHRYGHLRAQYQRRHQERQGVYPQDEKEERLQMQVQKQVDRKRLQPETVHSRSHSYDLYQDRVVPRSQPIVNSTNKYSHYVNYEEIQQHLLRQQNQSQAKPQQQQRPPPPPPVRRERPVSNFYEYETVRANLNHHRMMNAPQRTVNENKVTSNGHGAVMVSNRPPPPQQQQQQQQQPQLTCYTNGSSHSSSLRSRRPVPMVQPQHTHFNNYNNSADSMMMVNRSQNNQSKSHQSASSMGKFINNSYRGHPPPPPPSNGNKYMQVLQPMDSTAISGSKV